MAAKRLPPAWARRGRLRERTVVVTAVSLVVIAVETSPP
jgi:hypothetical protein